jgi:AraC-like DNA-binding protein
MRKKMSQALEVARQNIKNIRNVKDWSIFMGYNSPKLFSRKFRNHYGERPKSKLVDIRIKIFYSIIKNNSKISCYEVAIEMGLTDEIALSKYVKFHTGKPPKYWRYNR